MRSPFVDPQIVRIALPDGHWLDVKRELTYLELEEMFARMRTRYGPNESPVLDPTKIGRARMGAYIVGWSFTKPDGQPVPVTEGAINTLTGRMAGTIRDALEEHEENVSRESDAEKNAPAGESVSGPISPSVT